MTAEEKAKAYDEAVERAKKELNTCGSQDCDAARQIFRLFPELAESEDEEVRKELISLINDLWAEKQGLMINRSDYEKYIAWLEKQGKQKYTQRDIDDAYLKGITDTKHEVEKESEEDKKIRTDIAEFIFKSQEKIKDRSKWIEYLGYKPTFVGEKKEKVNHSKFKVDDAVSVYGNPLDYEHASITQKDFAPKCVVPKCVNGTFQVSTKDCWCADKPKFHEGDWIINPETGNINQIKNVLLYENGGNYEFEKSSMPIKSTDRGYRLWDISDAKDGDVLAGKIDGDDYILIFKQIKDGWIETYGHYYNAVDRFCVPSQLFCRDYQGTFTLATKEQCETLFKAMDDAGYKWDPDEKKLEKIEQKTWSEDDESFIKDLLDYFGNLKPLRHEMDDVVDWLETLKEKYTWPSDELMEKIENLRHKWSLGDSTEAKYKVEAYNEIIELLKEEKS